MKLSVSAVFAFAAAVLAKPIITNTNFVVQEGEPFRLTWTNSQGPVTISIMTGNPDHLTEVTDVATVPDGNEHTFTLNDLPSGTYAFRITDDSGEPNYSMMFSYVGTATVSNTLSETVTTTGTATSTATVTGSTETESATETETETETVTSATESEVTSTLTTLTSTSTETEASSTSTNGAENTNVPENTNNGQRFVSPLALVLGTVAALVFFN